MLFFHLHCRSDLNSPYCRPITSKTKKQQTKLNKAKSKYKRCNCVCVVQSHQHKDTHTHTRSENPFRRSIFVDVVACICIATNTLILIYIYILATRNAWACDVVRACVTLILPEWKTKKREKCDRYCEHNIRFPLHIFLDLAIYCVA